MPGGILPFSLAVQRIGSIGFLYSPKLFCDEKILVAFTMRRGGKSCPPYDSLNLGFHVGDSEESVLENRELLSSLLNLDPDKLTTAEQVHGNSCAVIDSSQIGKGARSYEDSVSGADALATAVEDAPLILFYADCVPVIIVDPDERCLAVVHAGWRGIADDIIPSTLQQLVQTFDSRPSNLVVYIGPCIGACCYQVGQSLEELFRQKFAVRFQNGRVGLSQLAETQLVAEGIRGSNIFRADLCTSCLNDMFFSYRKAERTGRHAALGVLLGGNYTAPSVLRDAGL